jgi:MFS transporter, DHA1 family, inner membrane transport protein
MDLRDETRSSEVTADPAQVSPDAQDAVPWPAMGIACAAALMTSVTPLLYGRMAAEGRLLNAQIGQIAPCELFALALVAGWAGARLKTERLRLKVGLAAAVFAIANLATAFATYPWVLGARTIAGLCEGIFIWALMQVFARALRPARIQGIYLALQGGLGFLVSGAYAAWVIPRSGAIGGFVGLAIGSLLVAAAALALPEAYTPLPARSGGGRLPTRRALSGLFALALAQGGVMALWVYLPPLAIQQQRPGLLIGAAVSSALVLQVIGGLSAARLDRALHAPSALIGGWVMFIGVAGMWLMAPLAWQFVLLSAVFGFLWMFGVPFGTSYIVLLDPTRRSLSFLTAAQPLGSGLGPMLASIAVNGTDVRGAILAGMAMLLGAIALLAAEIASRKPDYHACEMAT